MLKKLLFLFFNFVTLSTSAMTTADPGNIVSISLLQVETYNITDQTNVRDLKDLCRQRQGISPDNQDVRPLYKRAWTLWLVDKVGPTLDDYQNIKHIMREYNTHRFQLFLKG